MLKQLSSIAIITASTLVLSGCLFGHDGYIHNRQEDYLKSKSDLPLKIPTNLKTAPMTPALPIPAGKDFADNTQPSLLPPTQANVDSLQANQSAQKQAKTPVKTALGQGADGFPTLKLSASYDMSWFKINKALTKAGYQIIGSDQKTGVVEISSTDSDIYQIKVTAGSSGTLVSVLDQTGNDVSATVSRAILKKLQTQLGK
jgi:uncharacterized lipoprotein